MTNIISLLNFKSKVYKTKYCESKAVCNQWKLMHIKGKVSKTLNEYTHGSKFTKWCFIAQRYTWNSRRIKRNIPNKSFFSIHLATRRQHKKSLVTKHCYNCKARQKNALSYFLLFLCMKYYELFKIYNSEILTGLQGLRYYF